MLAASRLLAAAVSACVSVPRLAESSHVFVHLCNGTTFAVTAPELDPLAVIRGRVNGTAVAELVFERESSQPVWAARLAVPAGAYTAFVELQYERLDPENIWGSTPVNVPLVRGFAFVHPGDVPASAACTSFFEGHWLVDELPAQYGAAVTTEAVFVPRGCPLRKELDPLPGACFFGDSHMRHLHDEWAGVLESEPLERGTVRAVAHSAVSAYVDDPYGECFAGNMPFGTTGRFASRVHTLLHWRSRCQPARSCSVVLLGFGQWFVSHAIGDHAARAPHLSASAYAARVVEALRSANQSYPHVVWLTSHPLGERWPSMYTRPPTEWRTDGVLRAYNRAAALAAADAGFEVYDLFGMSNAVHDLTYDGSHYKAPVEREIARMVAAAARSYLS